MRNKRKQLLSILAIVFVLVNLLDILLTWGVLSRGGIEVNPVMQFVTGMGFWESVVSKVILSVLIASVLVRFRRLAILASVTTAIAGICIWNGLGFISML